MGSTHAENTLKKSLSVTILVTYSQKAIMSVRKLALFRINDLSSSSRSSTTGIFSLLIIAVVLCLSSCGGNSKRPAPSRIDQTEVFSIVDEVIVDHPKVLEPISKDVTPSLNSPFKLSLYVDQSQSMRGYIPPSGLDRFYDGSNFISLLHALGHQGELNRLTNAKSFGSGLPQGAPAESLPRSVDLMKPAQKDYNLLNNDFASLFDGIAENKSTDEISLILTDGVQSYQSDSVGSLMGATARSLKNWIARGGYVEILLSTAPFKGKYFSEELRAIGKEYTLNVDFPQRPFVLFVLIPNSALLDEWQAFKKRDRLKDIEFVDYRLPQIIESETIPTARPAIVDFSPEESQKMGLLPKENKPYLRLDNILPEAPWSKNLYSAFVYRKELEDITGKPLPRVPVSLEITAPIGWETDFDLKALATFRPVLRLYERNGEKDTAEAAKSTTAADKQLSNGDNIMDRAIKSPEIDENKKLKNWQMIKALDLRIEEAIFEKIEKDSTTKEQKLKLCFMVPWNGEQDLICALEMNAPLASVEPPPFDVYSTKDDSSANQLNKVYNFATLMEQLSKNENKTSIPSGFLLLIRNAK